MGTTSTARNRKFSRYSSHKFRLLNNRKPASTASSSAAGTDGKRTHRLNRQYGNIPKGSYSGSTYTVKKATHFSISPGLLATISVTLSAQQYSGTIRAERRSDLTGGNASGTPITGGNAITQADAAGKEL